MGRRYAIFVLPLILICLVVAAVLLWRPWKPQDLVSDVVETEVIPPLLAKPWGHGGEDRVDKIEELHGATEERVLAELGAPKTSWEYPMKDAGGEFRVGLQNAYPLTDQRNNDVRIFEWQWHFRHFSFAVWFHKVEGRWVVLQTLRWRDVVF